MLRRCTFTVFLLAPVTRIASAMVAPSVPAHKLNNSQVHLRQRGHYQPIPFHLRRQPPLPPARVL